MVVIFFFYDISSMKCSYKDEPFSVTFPRVESLDQGFKVVDITSECR